MTDRMLDLSERPARLSVRNGLLVVHPEGGEEVTVPLDEIGVLVAGHPQITYTQAVLAGIAGNGGAFVCCDHKHSPAGMLLPLAAHYVQAERFGQQAAAPLPVRKRLWQEIVRAKVGMQAALLAALYGEDRGIAALAPRVRSGDPANVEAQASRRYWPALFNDVKFRRDPDREDRNRLLNYGYGVLRAIVARAACAAGLHPGLGLHHHNRYDSFPLASDLMEPFRPLADRAAVDWFGEHGPDAPLDRAAKGAMLAALAGRVRLGGEVRTVSDAAARAASSLANVFAGRRKRLLLPEAFDD